MLRNKYFSHNIQSGLRSFAGVRITMDSHFSLTDKNPVDGKRTIHRYRTLQSFNEKKGGKRVKE